MKKSFQEFMQYLFYTLIVIVIVLIMNNGKDKKLELDFPKLSVQDIDKTYQVNGRSYIDEMMRQVVIYRDHLDLYTSAMCQKISLIDDTLPSYCTSKCHMVDDVPLIQIPMRIHIQDNGDYEDSVIIERLVDHINYLKDVMKKHNDDHQSLIDENKKGCLRFN